MSAGSGEFCVLSSDCSHGFIGSCGYRELIGMIEGFLIVKFVKCNKSRVDKNQQTPTLTADFQIRHGGKKECCVYRF